MRIDLRHGDAGVRWNDQGEMCQLDLKGMVLQSEDDNAFRDLYKVLAFLFERPAQ